jgi:hypothetical protein
MASILLRHTALQRARSTTSSSPLLLLLLLSSFQISVVVEGRSCRSFFDGVHLLLVKQRLLLACCLLLLENGESR